MANEEVKIIKRYDEGNLSLMINLYLKKGWRLLGPAGVSLPSTPMIGLVPKPIFIATLVRDKSDD